MHQIWQKSLLFTPHAVPSLLTTLSRIIPFALAWAGECQQRRTTVPAFQWQRHATLHWGCSCWQPLALPGQNCRIKTDMLIQELSHKTDTLIQELSHKTDMFIQEMSHKTDIKVYSEKLFASSGQNSICALSQKTDIVIQEPLHKTDMFIRSCRIKQTGLFRHCRIKQTCLFRNCRIKRHVYSGTVA